MKNVKDVKNILVIFGGVSSEYEVSLESAYAVLCNLDKAKYRPLPLGISRQGQWFYFMGDFSKIKEDTWCNGTDCVSAVLSPDRTAHELLLLKEERVERIPVDVAFPVLHGRFGEDGTVQGLVELAGIPLAGCAALASALCMDKDRAHKLAACFGVRVPKATVLAKDGALEAAKVFASQVGYPLFAKPVKAGSSYGVTKVEAESQLAPAIALAFKYDDRVILEEAIGGFEVGCAVLGTDSLIVGEVDEIELAGGFFDYTEKYSLKTSAIHVPARIAGEKAKELQETAKRIYRALDCSGFARVDMFLTPEGEIVFNEVNTIPGFTEHSRYPGMMRAAGYSFEKILDIIIEQAEAEQGEQDK
ncbi:MAG: D-alanine--D-serine ligase VanG [Acetatifactor sp.]|nr:D-alanine--D-serine ligase VanG [Acetatifactor sp.]